MIYEFVLVEWTVFSSVSVSVLFFWSVEPGFPVASMLSGIAGSLSPSY